MINPQALDMSAWGYGTMGATPNPSAATTTTTQPTSGSFTNSGGTMANTSNAGFQYPGEWDQAGDLWSQLASGGYSNQGMDWLTQMMQGGGNAFDVAGYDAANQPAMMDMFSNMTKEMAEQAGVGGTRYGSGLQQSIGRYGGQLQNQYNRDKFGNAFNAWEAGQGRAAGAGSLLSQLGLGARQAGGEGLMSLGSMRSQLPLQVAQMMGGLGGQLTGQQIDPWTQALMSGGMLGNTQGTEQMYNPSGFQSFLQGILPGLSQAFGGGGNPAADEIELPSGWGQPRTDW